MNARNDRAGNEPLSKVLTVSGNPGSTNQNRLGPGPKKIRKLGSNWRSIPGPGGPWIPASNQQPIIRDRENRFLGEL